MLKISTPAGRKWTAITFAGLAGPILIAGSMPICGIRINTSYSLPMGVYVRTTDPRAALIEFCPEGRFAVESSRRGYRTRGFCPDGAVPLVKPVVAQPGDTVEVSAGRDCGQWPPPPADCAGCEGPSRPNARPLASGTLHGQ